MFVGLDIGGTKFLVASSSGDGKIIKQIQFPTPVDFNEGIALLNRMIKHVSDGQIIHCIGAAIGGPLDWKKGIVSPLHQPEWRNIPLKEIMERQWKCQFYVDVDTNVAALGEYHLNNETAPYFLYITVSTGIGGGFLVNGKVYRGMNGGHPEIGHQSVHYKCSNPDAVECECGAVDCLEALVSGNGIKRIYQKPAEYLSEKEWAEVEHNLGQGLRNLSAIYLPDVIILGGGIPHGRGAGLIESMKKVLEKHLKIVSIPAIKLSKFGYDTALKGALVIAQHPTLLEM